MNIFMCNIGLAELTAEMSSVPLVRIKDGSGSPHFGGPEGWIHGLAMSRIEPGNTYPLITRAITELRDHVQVGNTAQVMVNMLHAGSELSAHRDGLPDHARFHLPLVTHPDVYWWDEVEGRRHMLPGWWYGPVPYCGILHSAGNPSPVDRLHVIVDFEKKGNGHVR